MKEIKTLIQQLRNYPNNFFASIDPEKNGNLTICDIEKEEQGTIEIGDKESVITK